MIVFDAADGGADLGFERDVKALLARILPGAALAPVARDHVLYRSFYVLDAPLGRTRTHDHALGVQEEGRLQGPGDPQRPRRRPRPRPRRPARLPLHPRRPAAARVGDPLRRQHPALRHLHRLQGRPSAHVETLLDAPCPKRQPTCLRQSLDLMRQPTER
jgi:hypothetical protein